MSTKFRNLKNDLKDLESEEPELGLNSSQSGNSGNGRTANYILLFAFIATLVFYTGSRFTDFVSGISNPITEVVEMLNEPNEELLQGMGDWMQEMGYGELTREELIDLRSKGVTATETSEFRDIGYTDVTLEQMVQLNDEDVSSTYARMMKELGYEFTVDDLVETRRNGVTANFTSRMMDLGYTKDELTKENLIRLRSVNVSDRVAERLIAERGVRPTVDELIRYRISNQ